MSIPSPKPRVMAARCWLALVLATTALLTACATPQAPLAPDVASSPARIQRSGRLSLRVDSEPPQNVTVAFDLDGHADAGKLHLLTPLGSTLAVATWSPTEALLQQGNKTQQYASLDDLLGALTGAPIPSRALFAWMQGQPQAATGWQVDVSRYAQGHISAQRLQPLPQAHLRVVLQ